MSPRAGDVRDAHRHLGVLPAFPFYGGPPVNPDTTARATLKELLTSMDKEGTERALVIPNYGVPDPAVAFSFNELCVEATTRSERLKAALWVSPLERDRERTSEALKLAAEPGVKALKLSFLLGGHPGDPACRPQLDQIFAVAKRRGLVVHIHTSPGAASDIDQVAALVEDYGDTIKIHLVHFGGGMSGHIKLAGHRFFDWIERGKQVYTDLSWAIGFAPRWLAAEIDRRGIGGDRVLFASDEPWGDAEGERALMRAATASDAGLEGLVFRENFDRLYGEPSSFCPSPSEPTGQQHQKEESS
jgi:predicted TIM-barrel fold metal-dependent hydrolase